MRTASSNRAIRQIIIFTILVNGLAWLGRILGGDPANPNLGFLIWGTAPIISALVMRFLLRDKISLGFNPALVQEGRAKNSGWYVLSILLYPVSIATVLVVGLLLGASTLNNFTVPAFVAAMLPLAVIYFVSAFFEEVGWRGYLAPRVYQHNDRLLGHVLVGLIWASWHFPYLQELWAHTSEGLETLLPRFVVGTIISTIVYGEIRLRTDSVWPAVLMHWVGNTIANTLLAGSGNAGSGDAGFVTLVPGKAWFSSFGVEGILMMIIFGAVGYGLMLLRQDRLDSTLPLKMNH